MKSEENRKTAVRMVLVDNKGVAEAARSTRMSRRSLTRFLRYFNDTGGALHYDPAMWNRHWDNRMDDPELKSVVLAAVTAEPEIFLDEIAVAVSHVAGLVQGVAEVSNNTVCRLLARNGFTRKVIEKAFITRNEARRLLWVEEQWKIPLRCRVYVDEAHRVGRAAERRWAWALRDERAECYVASSAGVRTSFFVAMAHDEVIDWMITRPPPGQSSVDFVLFLVRHLLPSLRSYDPEQAWDEQEDRCVLILDNARVHDEVALAAVRARGVFVLLLPPYSPDFNPIEDVFSTGSSWLRRWSSPSQFNDWPMSTIDNMLNSITGDMCTGFVKAAVRRYLMYVP